MDKNACFEIGHVVKPHGLKGEVSIALDVDEPSDYDGLASVLIEIKGQLVPYLSQWFQLGKNNVVLAKFDDVDTVEDAGLLRGLKLYLPLSELPELNEDQYYYHDVIGFEVFRANGDKIGEVEGFIEEARQPLMVINAQGKEVLLPLIDDIVGLPDKEKKCFVVHPPEGLIELYLNESDDEN